MTEPDVTRLIGVQEAIDIIDRTPVSVRTIEMPLAEAFDRRLAQDISADRDYPPFEKSLMDGYAVRCEDLKLLPATLRVTGEIAAGQSSERPVGSGEAMAIMTGAPLPRGADGVVPVEDVEKTADGAVRILHSTTPGRYIASRGSDCKAGQVVLTRGNLLGAAQIAVAASVGAARVKVFEKPRVVILGTGNELVPIEKQPGPAQIRESNSLMLAALARRMGCEVTMLGTARDEIEALRAAIAQGLRHDVLFVSGGMSMGQYDFVPRVLQELDVELRITKLRIKPGKPFVFGVKQQPTVSYVFGLPGNPVSSFVCTVRLASRLLLRLGGGSVTEQLRPATIQQALAANGPREFYQPAVLEGAIARPLSWKGSADLYTLAAANALIVRPENDPARQAGDTVQVLEI